MPSTPIEWRTGFDSPFCVEPAPLAREAALHCQARLPGWLDGVDCHRPGQGKMFGVLVVRAAGGDVGYLRAHSGMLGGCWQWPGFAPPCFSPAERAAWLSAGEQRLAALSAAIEAAAPTAAEQTALAQTRDQIAAERAALQAELSARKAVRAERRSGGGAAGEIDREAMADSRCWRAAKRRWREALAAAEAPVVGALARQRRLQQRRRELSRHLQARAFLGYRLPDARGDRRHPMSLNGGRMPPAGSGDCAAPRLLAAAFAGGYEPLALAEFWWGAAPADGVRRHGDFYPACRGKCGLILPHMLRGLPPGRQPPGADFPDPEAPVVLYEDEALLVVDKPAGLLSVPGKISCDSVQTRMQARYPDDPQLQLVHRLDQATSGLLLIARHRRAHKALQRQFSARTVSKTYIALLEGVPPGGAGEIDLPLRVDLDDRPRQLVCDTYGKPALSRWSLVAGEGDRARVRLQPVTGRTHQLRVHMAHERGLGLPIVGDELYGQPGDRLCLHAAELAFIHPDNGERRVFRSAAPF